MNNQIQLVLKSSTTELSLNDRELGIYLTPELDGLTGLPEIRTTSGVNAGYDGGWTSAQNYDARSITIRGVIANTDVATVERLRRQLTALAGQGKKEELTLDLVTEAGNAYTVQVRTIALEMALQKVVYQQEFMLQLRADDPLIYDASETGHEALLQVAQATGGFTIDFELPLAITGSSEETVVNNEGLEQVPTVTRMYGELHNPKIINQTTNQFMQINADLGFAEGDWIEPSEVVSGKDITINGAPEGAPLADFQLKGETEQNGTPTPDYPVPVQTVTGENVVKVNGKNLFSGTNYQQGFLGNDGSVASANESVTCIDYIEVQPSTSYTLSCNIAVTGTMIRGICYYTESKSFISRSSGAYENTYSFTTPNNAKFVRFYWYNSNGLSLANFPSYVSNIQLELGSTATAYEPYQGQSYEVNLGKNLFDKNNASGLFGGYISGGKAWTASGFWSYYIPCQPNTTYTASRTNIGNGGRFAIATSQDVPANNVAVAQMAQDNTATSLTITTNSSAKYIIVWFANVNDTGSESLADWEAVQQLELGSQATTYAPYFTPIELCKIGTYQDSIYKSGGKWYVRKAINRVTVDGSEGGFNSSNNWYFYSLRNQSLPTPVNNGEVISNYFTGSTRAYMQGNKTVDGLAAISTTTDIIMRNTAHTTDAAYKTWLSSTKPVFYYPLATPTDTEITNEALVAQLEALAAAIMYNPQTNITTLYADGNEQPTLDVSYFTDKNPDTRDELVIDSRLRTITLNGLDVYHLQAPGSEFLMLAPGENRLALQSDITGDNGYAQVSYKQGYLSI